MIKFIVKTLVVSIIFSLSFCVVYQYTCPCPKYWFFIRAGYVFVGDKTTGEYDLRRLRK